MPGCGDRYREALLTFDLVEGEERTALDAHLAECPECRARLDWLRSLEEEARRVAAAASGIHPSPGDLYDFAGGPGAQALDEETRRVTATHLGRCEDCAKEIRRIRAVDLGDPELREWIEEGADAVPSGTGSRLSMTDLLQAVPAKAPPPEPVRPTFAVSPPAPRSVDPIRRWLLPVAAAAAVVLSIVLWPKGVVPPPDAWIVLSPGTTARAGRGEAARPLRAGDRIPAGVPVENPGPEALVLARVAESGKGETRALVLEAGETLRLEGTDSSSVPIPNLTAVLVQPPSLPVLRGDAERSLLLFPRLTVRSKRPNFTFLPQGAGTYRAVVFAKDYATGEPKRLFETKPSQGPTLFFPEEAPSLAYDAAVYYEWALEREENGTFRRVDAADFYLHPSPASVEDLVSRSRKALGAQNRAAHFLVAQIYLEHQLFLAALQELLASDPGLEDAGAADLARRISRNLKIDLEAARPLLPILELR